MRVGIIGSSQNDLKGYHAYEKAVNSVKKEIDSFNILYKDIVLVSGGSSWADHIAVTLFLRYQLEGIGITLYLPTELKNNEYNTKTYFGRELNTRHRAFSKNCFPDKGINHSLNELSLLAALPNTKLVIEPKGFKARNTLIANDVDVLIAVSNTEQVSGGTKDTWLKFNKDDGFKRLLHFDT